MLSSGPSFVLFSVNVDPLVFVASCPCVSSVHACLDHMLHSTDWLASQIK